MTNAEAVQRQLAQVTSSRSESAVFVRMDGRLATVNIGTSTISIPCIGFYPPLPGMPVRVDWVNGAPAVTGPVTPLNPIGKITATGNPRATVEVDGASYTLPVMSSYEATVGDEVVINWNIPAIQGELAAYDDPAPPGENGGGGAVPFTVTVRAANSGRYQSGSGWWGRGPWASSSNDGIWVYGNRIRDAVGGGAVATMQVFLPLISQLGNASIGVHDYAAIPGGAPSIHPSSLMNLPLGRRDGWVGLTTSVGQYLAAGNRGLGVLAPGGGGYTRWRGVDEDGLSGAVRITGTR